jgi:hypothetical protein
MLDRAQALVDASRAEREAARARLEEASRGLLAGGDDIGEYAQVLRDIQPWIGEGPASDAGPAGFGIGNIARQIRSNAPQIVFAQADGLHAALRDRCAESVASVAKIPLPEGIFSASSIAAASALAIWEGFGDSWGLLVKAADVWDACHQAAALLRECGSLQHELMFAGPASVCVRYLGWQDAVDGMHELRLIPGPLRIRRAADLGWRPGCWLLSDHKAAAAAVEPKRRKLFAGKAPAPVTEFA